MDINLPKLTVPLTLDKHPIYKSHKLAMIILSEIIDNEIVKFADNKDVDGLIAKLKTLGKNSSRYMRMGYNHRSASPYIAMDLAHSLSKSFYDKKVDKCGFDKESIKKLGEEGKFFFKSLYDYTDLTESSPEYQYDYEALGDTFNKRMALSLASGIVNVKDLVNVYRMDLSAVITRAFGVGSSRNKNGLEVYNTSYNKANKELKDAFDLMVELKIGEIVTEGDAVGEWLKSLKSLAINRFQDPYTFVAPDVSKISDSDIKSVAKELMSEFDNTNLSKFTRNFTGFLRLSAAAPLTEIWIDKTIEVLFSIAEKGAIEEKSVFMELATNTHTAKKILDIFKKNIIYYKELIESLEISDVDNYMSLSGNRVVDTIVNFLNWIANLQNENKINLKNETFYNYFLAAYKKGFKVSFIAISNLKVLNRLLDLENDDFIERDLFVEFIEWQIENVAKIKDYFINMHENDAVIFNPDSIEFLPEKYISDKLISNYKTNVWPKMTPMTVSESGDSYKSPKMKKAFLDFVSKRLSEMKEFDGFKDTDVMANYRVAILSLAEAKQFNDEVKEIISSGGNVAEDIVKGLSNDPFNIYNFIKNIADRPELIDNLEEDVFINLIKISNIKRSIISIRVKNKLAEITRRVYINDESKIDALLPQLDSFMKPLIIEYLVGAELGLAASKEIFRDDIPIKPYQRLNESRIAEVLKYNRLLPDTKSLNNINSSDDINRTVINFSKKLDKIYATPVEETSEYFERKTVEYDVFNKYRHGRIAPKIIREFNVNLPKQASTFNKYITDNAWVEVMDPVFHGTGSVAASMILRYGFAVISSNDKAVAGRMLGDGIYFSNVIDKVSQYVADTGFTRGLGNKGYIFRMKAALGRPNKDFKSAGVEDSDTISPEWVVFHPEKQLLIYKALEVELVTKDEIDELKKKHNINESTAIEIKTFKEFIKESSSDLYKQATTYTFIDGNIPIGVDRVIPFEDFHAENFGNHIRLETSQLGPMVTIEHNGPISQAFCVRYTEEFMKQKEFKNFLDLLSGL